MNTQFNTIETISNDAAIINKSEAYLAACDLFEKESVQYVGNDSFMCRKSAEEVSLSYARAKYADCEYSVYINAHAAEKWMEQAFKAAR
jgi:hypothetical protein